MKAEPSPPLVGLALPTSALSNPIQVENDRQGTPDWEIGLGKTRATVFGKTRATAPTIEGYASSASVAPGETIDFHVSTSPPARYRIEIHRLGWYGGLGGRQHACLPDPTGDKQGAQQPDPPPPDSNGLVEAGWPVTESLDVPLDWISGYYVAQMILTSGPEEGKATLVPFVLRAPPTEHTAMVVVAPVNTVQAYNNWGGKCLYKGKSTDRVPANRVSFDRPNGSAGRRESDMFEFEYPLIRFLEREGYDVSYVTNVDVHRDPGLLLDHRMALTAGHDEYWTKQMRDGFEAARAAGVNLSFMGSNTAYWQVRYEDDERTIVCYKDLDSDPFPDPQQKTIMFRNLSPPRPECELLGVMYQAGLRIKDSDPPRDYTLAPGALDDPLMEGTGFTSDTILHNLVGYEWDAIKSGCEVPGTLVRLFRWKGKGIVGSSRAHAVRYTATTGSQVFSTGSQQFVYGLDDYAGPFRQDYYGGKPPPADPGLQQFMRNVFDVAR